MRRLVIDTNVYIDWLNAGRHETLIFRPNTVKYLSAVVLMELYAGAASRPDRKRLDRITQTFRKTGRILLPTSGVYEEAGHVLRRLHTSRKPSGAKLSVNDVLIALSARSIGATIITQNRADFLTLQRFCHVHVEIVPAALHLA